jgi:hypothetical protein
LDVGCWKRLAIGQPHSEQQVDKPFGIIGAVLAMVLLTLSIFALSAGMVFNNRQMPLFLHQQGWIVNGHRLSRSVTVSKEGFRFNRTADRAVPELKVVYRKDRLFGDAIFIERFTFGHPPGQPQAILPAREQVGLTVSFGVIWSAFGIPALGLLALRPVRHGFKRIGRKLLLRESRQRRGFEAAIGPSTKVNIPYIFDRK